jgi:chemotaxis protein CheD
MNTVVEIHIAELFVGDASHVIVTSGVGSCVVVVIHDRLMQIGGMAHAILPRAREDSPQLFSKDASGKFFVKFADSAVDMLLEEIIAQGGVKEHLVAKIVGGAHMFSLLEGDKFGIGFENVKSARERLAHYGIPIETEVVGGTVGRNVRFSCATGIVEIVTKV